MAISSPTRMQRMPEPFDEEDSCGKEPLPATFITAAGEHPGAYLYCVPIDLELSVVAPYSRLWESISLGYADEIPLPMPTAAFPEALHPPGPSHFPARPAAWLPRMPRHVTAAPLARTGIEKGASRRWGLLVVSFVGVALITHLMMGKTEPQPASANQAPPPSFENFSGGLERWDGAESGARPWTLQSSKGAMPGALALYKPSAGIADFRLEFLADIKKGGVSWAFRAVDLANYHALEIVQKKSGTDSPLLLSRYKVTGGKEGPRTQLPLQMALPTQSIWRIRMETIGETCTLWVEDQIANSWSEPVAAAGSIGFFAPKGEQFVLMRVRITPQ